MTSKLVVGPIDRGLKTDRTAFVIDNDSFPVLINAYQWRGRVKRKRGTSLLARLRRFFNSTSLSYSSTPTIALVAGAANILIGFGLEASGNIIPGTVTITDTTTGEIYTEPTPQDGTLIGSLGGSGTIIYSTGAITISGGGADLISVVFTYYPGLPVMGIEELELDSQQFPGTIDFDTVYSYNHVRAEPYPTYDVSFYKNPATATYPGYIQKTVWTPTRWNGENYQQFWTTNYLGALWATNGYSVPFDPTHVGMQYKDITGVVIDSAGPPAIATLTIVGHGLEVGDFIFVNEVEGITGINWQTGYVIAVIDANTVQVEFPSSTLGGAYTSGGIAQYLTRQSDPTKDCIRFYDGDPTNGNITTPTLNGVHGWVNFMPPLMQSPNTISNLPPAIYYLVGAKMIISFKNRLLFLGVIVQNKGGTPILLQDTVVYSEDGTPYYTASYTYTDIRVPLTAAPNTYTNLLVPDNQTAFPPAFFSDSIGFGGFIMSGLDEPIQTAASNEDAIIIGFPSAQTRFIFTGNDITPFDFYLINSELGSSSTFSSINMDRGVITRGSRGYIITSQTECRRIDLDNPDQVFQIRLTNNGPERFCSQRDFINEWIYFTYPGNQSPATKQIYPTETFQYNYRDESWAIFYETYTTYGSFRKQTGFTWQTVGLVYPTWSVWNVPWNAGSSTLLQPEVVAGNQQGFILVRDDGTDEGYSLSIQNFNGNTVTSLDHCLNSGDYIVISGTIGAVGQQVNGKIFKVQNVTRNTFDLNPALDPLIVPGDYFGGGLIKRMYIPFIQTKQFPLAWQDARKTRIGPSRFLFTKTEKSSITVYIYLSQNSDDPFNFGPLVPDPSSVNGSLVYSSKVYTCPESINLGLTPANVNLMTPTAINQAQIWHRLNTSLIGDTVQLAVTLNDEQMRTLDPFGPIGVITNATPTNPLVVTVNNDFAVGQLVIFEDIEGMTELNGNIYQIISRNSTSITVNVDATGFTPYDTGGTVQKVAMINQFAEIELQSFIMNIAPSQMLV